MPRPSQRDRSIVQSAATTIRPSDVQRLYSASRHVRMFLLVAALLLAPQAALVHAMSHLLSGPTTSQTHDDKVAHHASKVCDACLAFAQLAAALPARFFWGVDRAPFVAATAVAIVAADLPLALAFRSRAPPQGSI
jgi:hypothetical protein